MGEDYLVENEAHSKRCSIIDSSLVTAVSIHILSSGFYTYRWWQIPSACEENRPVDCMQETRARELLSEEEGDNRKRCPNPKHMKKT